MKEKTAPKGDFVATDNTKVEKKETVKKKEKKPGFFSKIGGKIKDVFSELKKVSWPTFGKVIKQTGVVLVVVLIFLIVITAFDFGLMKLLELVSIPA